MDNFSEQLVQKRKSGADIFKMITMSLGLAIAAFVCIFVSFFYKNMNFMLILGIGIIILGIWLLSGMNIEYEYIITNNEMDIDKIIGRRKRKRMITVDLSKTEDFDVYSSDKDIDADTTVHATTGLEKDAHYLLVQHGSYGKVKIIFNPNEKTREAIAQELSKALRAKLENNGE